MAKVEPGFLISILPVAKINIPMKARMGEVECKPTFRMMPIPRASRPPQIDPKSMMPKINFFFSVMCYSSL
jgi:hypothetical protein